MAAHEQDKPGTAAHILDVAEVLVQVRGFNAFSYTDVARELGISTAAVHHHFPGKAELGAALIARYAARFAQDLAAISARCTLAPARLDGFAGLHLAVLLQRRMCVCGVLAAEYQTLPQPMQPAVIRFFDQSETWLQRRPGTGPGRRQPAARRIRAAGCADDQQRYRRSHARRRALR